MQTIKKTVAKFLGGVHPPHFKDTAEIKSTRMPAPPVVILPLQQHIGEPCRPLVKVGDHVTVGQPIGDTDAFVSAPIHASVSGKVKAIFPFVMAGGKIVDSIHIENDGQNTPWENIGPLKIDSREDFLYAVRRSGIVGIGGAGFPAHVKLTLRDLEESEIDTLVVNGAECEPYVTTDYREMMENYHHILIGISRIMKYVGIKNCLIGIEDNKPRAIGLIDRAIAERKMGSYVSVVKLPSCYPQGAEKMMIRATTGRVVPLGGRPNHVGAVVMNISSVSILNYFMDTGIPLIRKRITVAGKAVKNPQNVFVPIGTSIREVVEFCGGYTQEPTKIIMGGPMMGAAQFDEAAPIIKQNNAILCLTEDETSMPEDAPCIRCGRCLHVCPMGLVPPLIETYARLKNAAMLKKLNVSGCMMCGSCAFVCPAKRSIVQYMRQGMQVKEAGK